jgi:hypothetical protein
VNPTDMTWEGSGVDPAKAAFVEAVAWTLGTGDIPLVVSSSGYGEDGYVEGSVELDVFDRYQLALAAWYRHARVPEPPRHLLTQEAVAWVNGSFGEEAVKALEFADPVWRQVTDLRERLARSGWDADTSNDARFYLRDQGHHARMHPETGQCAVTCLVVQDELGGELLRVEMPPGSISSVYGAQAGAGGHYFNRLPDGRVVDLTRGQFDSWKPVGPSEVRTREYLLSSPDTAARYALLRERVDSGRYVPERRSVSSFESRPRPVPARSHGRLGPSRY